MTCLFTSLSGAMSAKDGEAVPAPATLEGPVPGAQPSAEPDHRRRRPALQLPDTEVRHTET